MISFESDYTTGAHPKILQRLADTNMEALSGYGTDPYCRAASEKILDACGCPDGRVFFLTGGTQTNALVISSMLRPYEGVLAADTGHVSVHEAGAIEYTGHKVLTLPHHDGKIDPSALERVIADFYLDQNHEHMVFPGMVYLSHPTEFGTLYTKEELTRISEICRSHHIPLYLDGARLGYGLMSPASDLTLPEIAALCDVFYIGGTKVGALCGEAVVFPDAGLVPSHFVTVIKQHGALLAKGRLIGIQFDTLFTDNLYFEISRHAIEMADRLSCIFTEKQIPFAWASPTNQQFVILENSRMEALQKQIAFSFWEKADDTHTIVRFATSWSTRPEELEFLENIL